MVNKLERARAKAEAAEAERIRQERFAQLADELAELGAKWKEERGPRRSLWEQDSETLTLLEQKIEEACSEGMSEHAVNRASRVSRGKIRRIMGKD